MAILALVVLFAWLGLVVGVPGYTRYRRTGEVSAPRRAAMGTPQWWARTISGIGILFAIAAPAAELAGLEPIPGLDIALLRWPGLALAILGIAGTLGAQAAMGESWRPDIDPDARAPLVTTGPFRLVRNPVLTCTLATALGLALIVPNVLAALMLGAFVIGIHIQVKLVEEPFLERAHGEAYRRYAQRTGRFLPGIGRGIRRTDRSPEP